MVNYTEYKSLSDTMVGKKFYKKIGRMKIEIDPSKYLAKLESMEKLKVEESKVDNTGTENSNVVVFMPKSNFKQRKRSKSAEPAKDETGRVDPRLKHGRATLSKQYPRSWTIPVLAGGYSREKTTDWDDRRTYIYDDNCSECTYFEDDFTATGMRRIKQRLRRFFSHPKIIRLMWSIALMCALLYLIFCDNFLLNYFKEPPQPTYFEIIKEGASFILTSAAIFLQDIFTTPIGNLQ